MELQPAVDSIDKAMEIAIEAGAHDVKQVKLEDGADYYEVFL